jgi:sigma-B regulation protein RsbU (phosphoserine phosphatase)
LAENNLREENERLRRAVEELAILNDLARAIGGLLNSQEIMQTIIRRSLRAIGAEQGVITLIDEKKSEPMKTLVRTTASSADHQEFHLNQSLLGWMYINKKPLLVEDPSNDARFRGVAWNPTVKSLICVPLMAKSQLVGILTLFNKRDAASFTESDQRLLAIIGSQSAQVVENARLYEEELKLRKMQEEVRLASKIQLELLPKAMPEIPGYDIAATTLPAQQVGGDYFDYVPLENSRWGFCLADVTGKGLPASLLMANLQATIRGQASIEPEPKICLRRANRLLFQSTSPEKFATMFYGILSPGEHLFHFSNAGHDPAIVFGLDGKLSRLEEGGIPLGMFDDYPYEDGSFTIQSGDTIVIYSDGVTEAWNPEEQEFGQERLASVIDIHRDKRAGELVHEIITAVKSHAGTAPQADDITIMVIKRQS